jgi:hypothetical protein
MAAAQIAGFPRPTRRYPFVERHLCLQHRAVVHKSSPAHDSHFCSADFAVKRIADKSLRSMSHPNFEVREVHGYAPGMRYECTTNGPSTLHDRARFRTKGPLLRTECAYCPISPALPLFLLTGGVAYGGPRCRGRPIF